MLEIGKINNLRIVKEVDFGLYLDGGDEMGEILIPTRYVPETFEIDEFIDVFIYLDSEDRIIATTETPLAMVGQFTVLEVVSITGVGAFLNWGLPKDLLVPFREQNKKLEVGDNCPVYVYLDLESQRIVASTKVEKFLDNIPVEYEVGEEVDLIIYGITELGFKAIVDDASTGVIYKNEVFQKLKVGDQLKGYIKKVRDDEKLDLSLAKPGVERFDQNSEKVLAYLKDHDGNISITDKSSPEIIYETFEMSKKNYKKALGALYKKKLILIEKDGIKLAE